MTEAARAVWPPPRNAQQQALRRLVRLSLSRCVVDARETCDQQRADGSQLAARLRRHEPHVQRVPFVVGSNVFPSPLVVRCLLREPPDGVGRELLAMVLDERGEGA